MHALIVPHGVAGRRGHPPPPQDVLRRDLGEALSLLAATSESRRRVPSMVSRASPLQQQVEWTRSTRPRRERPDGAADLPARTSLPAGCPVVTDAAPQAAQVGLAREVQVDQLEPPRGLSAATAEHRWQDPKRRQADRAPDPPRRAGTHPAGLPSPWPRAREPPRTRRPGNSPAPRPARARHAAPGGPSARRTAAGTPPPRRYRREPAHGRPSARARRRPPRRVSGWRGRGARPAGPGRSRRRWHRPGHDARGAGRLRLPSGRRRTGRAGVRTPPARPARAARRPVPGPPPRCRSRASLRPGAAGPALPRGSAAAVGRATACRKAAAEGAGRSSVRSCRRPADLLGKTEPARQIGDVPRARQLEQGQRVAVTLHDDLVADSGRPGGRARWPAAAREPRCRLVLPIARLGQPGENVIAGPVRAAHTTAIRSARRRRATNPRICAEARSSHCASSTRQASGCCSATSANSVSVASPTRNRSGAALALRPNTVASASRCGAGSRSEVVQHGRAELVQAAVGQLHLRLHAGGPGDMPADDPAGQVPQQRALAHARLAPQDVTRLRPASASATSRSSASHSPAASEEPSGAGGDPDSPAASLHRSTTVAAGISRAYIRSLACGTPQTQGPPQGVSRVRRTRRSTRVIPDTPSATRTGPAGTPRT